jgi:hypothetical protein
MKNIFISVFAVSIILFSGSISFVKAQDSLKKPVAQKPATVKPPVVKPGYVNPYSKYHHYNTIKATGTTETPAAPVTGAPQTTGAPTTGNTTPLQVNKPAEPDSTLLTDKSLNGQYKYLLSKVYRYQQPLIAALWKNFTDTLNANHRKLVDAQAKALAQTKTISDLKLKVDSVGKEQLSSKADDIDLLGILLAKNTYSSIMWGLVIILSATAAVVIFRSGSLSREAHHRINLYNELEEEFKVYKTKANDKEKKLARELQTERNKVDELLGRG